MDGAHKIAAIIPAYNEERDIAGVLREITSYPRFDEVIVIDDGSKDATAQIARTFSVRLIQHTENRGKGAAMRDGVAATDAQILFFCDADMRGFTHATLESILKPVIAGETDMVIAMRNSRMYYAGFVLSLIPILGGQRAVRRSLWDKIPAHYLDRFMVETALNFYARYWGNGFQYKVVPGLSQTIKERKYGLWKGIRARLKMIAEVIEVQVRLQFVEVPGSIRTGRLAFTNMTASLSGALLGVVIVFASYTGPALFVRELFEKELLEDPQAFFVNLLLYVASNVSIDLFAFIGASLIALNVFFAALNVGKLRFLAYHRSPVERIG